MIKYLNLHSCWLTVIPIKTLTVKKMPSSRTPNKKKLGISK